MSTDSANEWGDSLDAPDPARRIEALLALGRYPSLTSVIINKICTCLKDESSEVRRIAAAVLCECGTPNEETVGALTAALGDVDPIVRRRAAMALGFLGSGAVMAIPALCSALRDEDGSVIRQAIATLGELGPLARKAAAEIHSLANGSDCRTRALAAVALRKIEING
jgi:HEAT repeat protein